MSFFEEFISKHKSRQVTIKGKTFEYLVGGNSSTAFLIFPGGGQNALSCFDLIDAFEKSYKVIAVNISGLADLNEFFEYTDQILKKENVKNIFLYGLSLGGFLAQHYVRHRTDLISKLIISHAGSTKSPTIIKKVIIPGKILHFFLPIIPLNLFEFLLKNLAGKIQAGRSNLPYLYKKYSTKENSKRRREFFNKYAFSFLNREYLESFYRLGMDMVKTEKSFSREDLNNWKGKILILRTDNDPLAQDDGIFKDLYPKAKVYTFYETGHLTPFIQFENMVKIIKDFLHIKL